MKVHSCKLTLTSDGNRVTYHEITEEIRKQVKVSCVKNGICTVISPHTTCSVIFEEYSYDKDYYGYEYLQVDLNEILESIIPDYKTNGQYHHPGKEHIRVGLEDFNKSISPEAFTMLNTDAHLKSTLLGSSEIFNVEDGELQIGMVGYIYFIDWDRLRVRDRVCQIKVIGV